MKKRKAAIYTVIVIILVLGIFFLYMFVKYHQSEKEIKQLTKKPVNSELSINEIKKLIREKDPKKRLQALKQIKKLSKEEKIKLFVPMLKSNDILEKTTAVSQLLLIDDEKVKSILLDLYKKETNQIIKDMIKNKYNPDKKSTIEEMDADNVVKEPAKKEENKSDEEKESEKELKKEASAPAGGIDNQKKSADDEKKTESPENRKIDNSKSDVQKKKLAPDASTASPKPSQEK